MVVGQVVVDWARRGCALGLFLLVAACGEEPAKQGAQQAPPAAVGVMTLEPKPITPQNVFIGRIVAYDSVELRARITGWLDERLFTEGDLVKKNDLLFRIEKAPFQAALDEAKAGLASAQATAENAAVTVQRADELIKRGNISQAEQDKRIAALKVAQADVLNAQAQVQTAEINLGYTDVISPIDGRIGLAAVDVGNLVSPDTGVLATVVAEDPVYVTFNVGQSQLLEFRKRAEEAGLSAKNVVIQLLQADGSYYEHKGKINFVDVQAAAGTDTVLIRGTLPNPKKLLVANQTVRVVTELDKPEMALVVPQDAILLDQLGGYVFVVTDDNKAERRNVKYHWAASGLAVIDEGVKEGEKIIVEGLQKVRPGGAVQAGPVAPAPQAPS